MYEEKHKIFRKFLFTEISDKIDMSCRLRNCLAGAGIITFKDLYRCSENTMIRWRNFGKKCRKELEESLNELGMSLKDFPIPAFASHFSSDFMHLYSEKLLYSLYEIETTLAQLKEEFIPLLKKIEKPKC